MTKEIIEDLLQETIDLRNCKFGFKCNQSWFRLNETENKDIKFCSKCEKNVYMVHNNNELANAIQENKCVALRATNKPGMLLGMIVKEEKNYDIPSYIRLKLKDPNS